MNLFNEKTALLLIDIQEGFNGAQWGNRYNPNMEKNVTQLLKLFREKKAPVIHVQHLSRNPKSPLSPGQPGVDIMEAAKPLYGERLFQKHVNSAFIGTNLEEVLKTAGIKTLVIGGIAVDHCVSTTTRMAANLGFNVVVAADLTVAYDRKGFDGKNYPAETVHSITLASLHGEFATVMTTAAIADNFGISQ